MHIIIAMLTAMPVLLAMWLAITHIRIHRLDRWNTQLRDQASEQSDTSASPVDRIGIQHHIQRNPDGTWLTRIQPEHGTPVDWPTRIETMLHDISPHIQCAWRQQAFAVDGEPISLTVLTRTVDGMNHVWLLRFQHLPVEPDTKWHNLDATHAVRINTTGHCFAPFTGQPVVTLTGTDDLAEYWRRHVTAGDGYHAGILWDRMQELPHAVTCATIGVGMTEQDTPTSYGRLTDRDGRRILTLHDLAGMLQAHAGMYTPNDPRMSVEILTRPLNP